MDKHVEVLKILRGGYDNDPAHAALTAAIAALEAVGNGVIVEVADNAWIGCVPEHLAGQRVLIIPPDAVGG